MSTEKLSYIDFAKSVKEKYPQYADKDDYELAEAMVSKYPEYSDRVDLKKKDLSFEEFQTSMEGASEAPAKLESEALSTPTEEKTEKDTHLDIINKQIENVSAQREQLAEDRTSAAIRKITLERETKRIERQLSAKRGSLTSPTGRTSIKVQEDTEQLKEKLKSIKEQSKASSEDLEVQIDKERDLETAHDFLEKSKRMLEAPDENSLKAFKEGLLSPLAKDFFTIGVGEMARQYNVLDIVNKYREKGEDSLTDEERTALGAYGIMQMASENPASVSYNVGSGVAEMIPYMVQFAMTGGVGGFAKESTKSLLKAQTKRGIKKAIAEGTAYAVGAAARTPLMTMTQEEFARRRTGVIEPIAVAEEGEVTEIKGKPVPETEETVGEAVYKSFATTFPEVFTEELGGIVTKPLGKLAGRIGKTNLLKGVKGTVIDKVKDAVKFNGVIGEYSEELANSYLQAALTKDKPLSEVWNGKEQLETALTVSTVGGVFMASNLAAPKLKTELKVVEDNREETFSNIDEQYQEEVLRIAEIEDVEEKSTVLEQYIFERDLNEDQIKSVTEFIVTDNAIKSAEITQEEIVTEKPIEDSEAIKKEKEPITIPEEKEAVKRAEIIEEVKPKIEEDAIQEPEAEKVDVQEQAKPSEEVVEEVKKEEIEEKEVEYDKFKTDFLSEEVNLQNIDVPLKQSERIAAAKNLREGKITKQAEILEDYLKQSFESGKLPLVEFAAGKKTVRTTAPIESILKAEKVEPVKEVPTEKLKEVKEPIKEPIIKEKTRKMGERVMKSKVLDQEFKTELAERGIKYAVRGRKVTDIEANEIAKVYKNSDNLDGLKSVILDRTNSIKGDTRTALAVGYYNEVKKLEESTKDPIEKAKYRQDRSDIYYSEMNTSTDVAQDLQSKRRWVEVVADDPEIIKEAHRRDVDRRNEDFLEKNKKNISSLKGELDAVLENEEFKAEIEKRVKQRFERYVGDLKNSTERRVRGKAKVASGVDRLANIIGAKKNAVADNETSKDDVFKAVIEIADGLLDIGIANTSELIAKIKSTTREYLSSSEIDKITNKIIKETDAENRFGKPKKKELSDDDIKAIAKRLSSKLEDLSPKQVRNILKDYIDEFERLGYVSNSAFNSIYAKALGKEYVSPQDEQLIENAANQINEAKKVKNNIETLFDQILEEQKKDTPDKKRIDKLTKEIEDQTKVYQKEFKKAQVERRKLTNVLAEPRNIYRTVQTTMRLNLMAFTSFIVNWTANLASTGVRLPSYYVATALDYGAYGVGFLKEKMLSQIDKSKNPNLYNTINKLPNKETTYDALAYSKGFMKGFAKGAKESMIQMVTGMLPEDLAGKDLYRSMQPITAWINNYKMLRGKQKADAKEAILNLLEGTIGINPEIAARILNVGDKPFREAGKRGRLEEMATKKGLKGNEKKRFLMFPDEESLAEATQHGAAMALQQDNFISDVIHKIGKEFDKHSDKVKTKFIREQIKGLSLMMGGIIQPFVKTPTNYIIEGFTFAMPELSLALGVKEGLDGNRRKALDYFGRAIVGIALRRAVQTLFGLGIMSLAAGGEEDEDEGSKRRLKDASWEDRGNYRVNWSAFGRLLNGEDVSWREDDVTMSYQPFGIISMVGMANAQAFEGMTQYEIQQYLEESGYMGLLTDPIGVSGVTVRSALDQSFLKGQYGFMKALMEGGDEADRFAVQMSRTLGAIIAPNWYSSIARWEDNIIRETREKYVEDLDGKVRKEMVNSFKVNWGIKPDDLPAKLSIYGDDVNRFDNKSLWNIIDPFKTEKHNLGIGTELVDLYRKTKNVGIIPQNPKSSINIKDQLGNAVSVKLTSKLYYSYSKPLIQAKLSEIRSTMNSVDYAIGNDEEKAELLERLNSTYMQSKEAEMIKEDWVQKNYQELMNLYKKQSKNK
jgi:hypothetical protein